MRIFASEIWGSYLQDGLNLLGGTCYQNFKVTVGFSLLPKFAVLLTKCNIYTLINCPDPYNWTGTNAVLSGRKMWKV